MLGSHDDKHFGTGSVTAQIRGHVLRNDVLQQHIDARTRLKRGLFLFLDGATMSREAMACSDRVYLRVSFMPIDSWCILGIYGSR